MHGYIAADQMQALKAQIKGLTVDRLKNVLRSEGQTVSGVKSELQVRLISYVEKVQNAGDRAKIDRIRNIVNGNNSPYSGSHHYPSPHTPQSSASPQQFYSPHLKHPGQGTSYSMAPNRSTYGHGGKRHLLLSFTLTCDRPTALPRLAFLQDREATNRRHRMQSPGDDQGYRTYIVDPSSRNIRETSKRGECKGHGFLRC